MRSGRDYYERNTPRCARCYRVLGLDDSPISCSRCNADDLARNKEAQEKKEKEQKRCEECDPSYGCFDGSALCSKRLK